jgi:hypothetical protein
MPAGSFKEFLEMAGWPECLALAVALGCRLLFALRGVARLLAVVAVGGRSRDLLWVSLSALPFAFAEGARDNSSVGRRSSCGVPLLLVSSSLHRSEQGI